MSGWEICDQACLYVDDPKGKEDLQVIWIGSAVRYCEL